MHDYAVSYPDCVTAPDYLGSDCGSSGWAYILFLSFNIISMYIFTAVFTGVVSDNFSYVYQIASNYSLVSREQIRKYPFFLSPFILYISLIIISLNHAFLCDSRSRKFGQISIWNAQGLSTSTIT